MNKVLQATDRGQITLPKSWRDSHGTKYFEADIQDDQIVIKPILKKSFEEEVEAVWDRYKEGKEKIISQEELLKKYGL